METITLKFKASGQKLTADSCPQKYASNTVNYIRAEFELGDGWDGFDVVRAVWATDFAKIATILDTDGVTMVPWEVLKRTATLYVNLVGSISDGDELTDRLTTYKAKALDVNGCTNVDGDNTQPITPSQFEQFVAIVSQLVATVKDLEDVRLNPDYTITFIYSDGTESEPIGPIRGATGNGIARIDKTGTAGRVDTYTITYTDGNTDTFTVTNGEKGDPGRGIQSIVKTGTVGLVDTYTITYSDSTTSTFTVTNGEKGDTGNGIDRIELTDTSGAVKTYTIFFTDGTTTTFTVTDGEVTNAVLDEATIVQTNEDSVPYLFRKSGGDVKTGRKETGVIVGGTVGWNQLVQIRNGGTSYTVNDVTCAFDSTTKTFKLSGVSTNTFSSVLGNINLVAGHKYALLTNAIKNPNEIGFRFAWLNASTDCLIGDNKIVNAGDTQLTNCGFSGYANGTDFTGIEVDLKCIDLTAYFGTTIADYVYTLESGQAGAGVAWLRQNAPQLFKYNACDSGSLVSVSNLQSHDMVEKNLFDGEYGQGTLNTSGGESASTTRIRSGYLPVLANTVYALSTVTTGIYINEIYYYDANKTHISHIAPSSVASYSFTTPTTACYLRFTMRKSDNSALAPTDNVQTQLEFGSTATAYEPYVKHTYALDDSITLRGIPKLDASNNLYYDGDTYESDGTVTRNTIYRAYQSGDESLANAITDGTNTVVYSANASTETADPYTTPQLVDPHGTEEFVGSPIPVGHETEYPMTLTETMPEANGTYTLSLTVSGGKRSVNWT